MSGSRKNYNFGQKNHWRRTVWNEVLRRTNGAERTRPILYLAGPNDLDRAIAISKGVPPENLIAIDRDRMNVVATRKRGHVAIESDIADVLWSWPDNRPAAAVLLDFCCGVTRDTAGVLDAFQRRGLADAVVMVNFMRGRDAWSNHMRQLLDAAGLLKPLWKANLDDDSDPVCILGDTKHRAFQFLMMNAWDMWCSALGKGSASVYQPAESMAMPYIPPGAEGHDEWVARIGLIFSGWRPKLYSYQSGVLRFDSAVIDPIFGGAARLDEMTRILKAAGADGVSLLSDHASRVSRWLVPSVARKITAAIAVATRRKNVRTNVRTHIQA